ncbi:MAG: 2-hydroxychromene-2-carboxylate isomerase [Rhodospirillales bacterium]|nr:2-hydroxychromene-2-carboxylate isomerase [Rhodospirillales bacterium]
MSDPVTFYFDLSSPYGYFAAQKIDQTVADFDRTVVWKPIMLGAAMKETGNRPLAEQPIKGDYCKHDWERLAKYMDVAWTMPDPFPITTLAAARAFYWIDGDDPALAKKLALAAYHAYFGEGRDITAPETIADIAEPLGIDRDALLAAVQDPAIKERLKQETADALAAGVFGSPFVIIDGEPFWGADRLWMIRRWLKSGGW